MGGAGASLSDVALGGGSLSVMAGLDPATRPRAVVPHVVRDAAVGARVAGSSPAITERGADSQDRAKASSLHATESGRLPLTDTLPRVPRPAPA